ncbi:protein FAM13A isoform X2 [Spea bombifrons]|uniref:protein FAM13A isoform X2 n=1 Tax=Spea bombifrons TaxID=233779 RepID=UPI00234BD7AD|nr:protein FAM13A isoform X2 [Spea bombifrons]
MPKFLSRQYKSQKMQPPVVSAHDCSLFLYSFKQSKAAVRLKEDMKKVVARPGRGQPSVPRTKVFGAQLKDLHKEGLVMNSVPSVVWSVVEYLRSEGMTQEGLFRVNGNVKVVEQLRLRYETGEPVMLADDTDVHSVASLLKLFLREMPDGIISAGIVPKFIQVYHESGNDTQRVNGFKNLLKELPDTHYSLLKYLCHFLTQVVEHQAENRMNCYNLATVFGPNCFHVASGFEGMKQQETCNKILERLLEDYTKFFESEHTEKNGLREDVARIITVKEYNPEKPLCPEKSVEADDCIPSPRTKEVVIGCPNRQSNNSVLELDKSSSPRRKEVLLDSCIGQSDNSKLDVVKSSSPRRKVIKSKVGVRLPEFPVPQPKTSEGIPQTSARVTEMAASPEDMDLLDHISLPSSSTESVHSSQEDERPMSPFYMSGHVTQVNTVPAGRELLERTIRTAVEQHLFDVLGPGSQSSEDSESGTSSPSTSLSARQRRRHLKEHDETRKKPRDMEVINKENIPSGCGSLEECGLTQEGEKLQENCSGYIEERSKPKRQKSSSKLSELNDNQESTLSTENFISSKSVDRQEFSGMEVLSEASKDNENDREYFRPPPTVKMKIQEPQNNSEAKQQRGLEVDAVEESFVPEVPRLDLTSLCDDNNWEEPVPAQTSWDRDPADPDEARLSPQAGRLIRQLLEADSDPMLSPRFYAYGHSQQFLDDTEVPPSPPNSHSFVSRRRSSSLGSHEDDRDEDLTPAQLTRKIQSLKKKIRKFEEKFEEDRKYRPSHRDKATNPEVLKWMNELAKFRKQLKESKLKISEEDLVPQVRQRSNTLPKSFGSQLDREEERKQEVAEKITKPSIETTLESIQKKLEEKRAEVNRPDDVKDMTRDQIAAEKVSLQKALLFYESVHGRPVTKNERQLMKPLYDRYRLFKQILYRANTIPVIGSPSSKRRSPLLQPIIEGETASFFKEEEEEGSDEDSNANTDFAVTMKPGFTVKSFLDQLEEDADGFVSPVDDKTPSKSSQDLGLGNLHSASVSELLEQLQEAKEEKKRIRKKLRDFEDNFFRQNGRNVQKEDRTPMAEEYSEYKHMRAKIRLLEVLITKRGTSQPV